VLGVAIGSFQITLPVVVLGCITGLMYGVLAVGLILVYKQSRVINFAHGEIGAFGATFVGLAVVSWHLNYWIVIPIGILLGAGVGASAEVLIIRRLRRAPLIISVIATLGLGSLMDQVSAALNTNVQAGSTFPQPPGFPEFSIGPLLVTRAYTGMLILTPIVVLALVLFLRYSRLGMAMRATSANPDASSLAGVRSGATSAMAWAIAGGLAAFTAILVMPTRGFTSGSFLGPELLLRALAVAVVARMSSMTVAMIAGVGVGIVEQLILANEASSALVSAILFLIILVGLLVQKPHRGREEDKDVWASITAFNPIPQEWRAAFAVRNLGRIFLGTLLAVGIVLPLIVPAVQTVVLIFVVAFAAIGLSLVIITALCGQLSLGQFAIAGVGATVSYLIASHTGSFVLSFLCAGLAAAGISLLIGLPALRIKGIMLGVTTLAFALAAQDWLFGQPWMLGNGVVPGVPTLFGLTAGTPRSYYYFTLVVFVILFRVVMNIWRGGIGRRLRAVRDNEDAARSFGLHPTSIKLQAFLLAGFVAGIGGALIGHSLSYLEQSAFPYQDSLNVAAMSALGGLGVVIGPLIGAAYIVGIPQWIPLDSAGLAATSLGWLGIIVQFPGGLAQANGKVYDRLVRILGTRSAKERRSQRDLATATPTEAFAAVAVTDDLDKVAVQEDLITAAIGQLPRRPRVEVPVGEPLLTATGLSKSYGGVLAVDNVTFEVRSGEILGLIGPNGAGKTTLFELLSGFNRADSGRVVYLGHDVTRLAPDRRAQLGLVRSFQDVALFPTLSVVDAVTVAMERTDPTRLATGLLGLKKRDKLKQEAALEVVRSMGLYDHRETQVRNLSTGMRRIAELACLVAVGPQLLLLDEPAAGIAQRETEALAGVLRSVKERLDLTLVIVEHDIPLLMALADRVIAMESGAILIEGTPEEVRASPEVIEAYLGRNAWAIERSGEMSHDVS
jgi:ABC-type branched-subunit amino acid transport system ATPase component/ABC-type branched-subunit amino acid transport system permease subunit